MARAAGVLETLESHLTHEQRDLLADTRELAASALKPLAEAGEPGRVNRPLVGALGQRGLLGRLYDPDDASREV
jgi:acyl-CoA dehydrogenase